MRRTVLTIDDQIDIRCLIRMTLEFEGINVIEAEDGERGLAMARRHRPDLILCDVMMPGLSGLAVSQVLSQDEDLKKIPVVMLSALDRDHDIRAGKATGAKVYLTKPFGPVELLRVVESLIAEATGNNGGAG